MATASTIQKVCRTARPLARCAGNKGKSTAKRTPATHRNGFLNHRFQPIWDGASIGWQQIEREFFSSLSHLCILYKWQMPDVPACPFPQNVWQAYTEMKIKCREINRNCLIVADKTHRATLVVTKQFCTNYTLYYIPVKPLWRLLSNAKDQSLAFAFVQVFKYLHKKSGVAWCEGGNYIMNEYEAISDWITEAEDDDEAEYRDEQLNEIALLKEGCNKIGSLLNLSSFQLGDLQHAIAEYEKSPDWDLETGTFFRDFSSFCRDYPERSITASLDCCPTPDGERDRVYMEQYLSFYWSADDCLTETLYDMVNNELQEYSFQEEPVSIQWFDEPQAIENHDFTYEQRFFELINALTDILNKQDDGKHNE